MVTALLEDGTPHVQTLTLEQPPPQTLPPVVFSSVPLGGMVNVSVAFYQAATGTSQRILLARGTSGLVENIIGANPSLTIEEVRYPIDASTVYEHRQKTALDSSNNHIWDTSAPAPTVNLENLDCGTAGTLCNFQSITVRQETGTRQGYVGYGWQGWGTGPSNGGSCGGGLAGQLDQMANLNTGPDAQMGYLAGPCGLESGREARLQPAHPRHRELLSGHERPERAAPSTGDAGATRVRAAVVQQPPAAASLLGCPELHAGFAPPSPGRLLRQRQHRESQDGDAPDPGPADGGCRRADPAPGADEVRDRGVGPG